MDFRTLADIPVTDGHVHFAHLERMSAVLEVMGSAGVAKINLVSLPDAANNNHNAALLGFKLRHPEQVYISGALDYLEARADRGRLPEMLANQVARLKAVGFDGIKLIEGKPTMRKWAGFSLDAPEYQGMWAEVERHDLPVVWHVADPEEFWDWERCPEWARSSGWCYAAGQHPAKEQLYAEADHVLRRNPGLRIIFAHFYFLSADLRRAGALLDAHPNVSFDLTPGIEMYNNFTRKNDAAREFFIRYQDRLIYGTDISSDTLGSGRQGMFNSLGAAWLVRSFLEQEGEFWMPLAMSHWLDRDLEAFCGLGLPRPLLEKIYFRNFERMFGLAPKRLHLDSAVNEMERLASVIDARPRNHAFQNQARRVAVWLREASAENALQ